MLRKFTEIMRSKFRLLTILIVFVYAISFLPIAFAQYESCTDSDGISYDVAGYVSLTKYTTTKYKETSDKEVIKFSDYCFDGKNTADKCVGDSCYAIDYSCEKGELDWDYNEQQKNCVALGYTGCSNGACTGTPKVTETCFDGIKNQDETDVDCGGVCGSTCKVKQSCLISKDCVSLVCDNKICTVPVQKEPQEEVTENKKDLSENKEKLDFPAVTVTNDKKKDSCEEKCYQDYGKQKILYDQCVKQKCEEPKRDDKALAITSPLSKKLEIQKKIIAEPSKKIEISKGELLVDGVKVDNKTVFIKTGDKEVRITSSKKKIMLKEYLGKGFSAEVDTHLIYEKDKIISGSSGKQVKIFPSDIKQKVSGEYTLKLVDDGSPKYLVNKKSPRNLFGFIPITLDINYEISAEDGEILVEATPFWHFLTAQTSANYASDGDLCWINVDRIKDPDLEYVCDTGLRCENVLTTSNTIGRCKLYPPAFHGKVVFIWDSWEDLEEYFEIAGWDDHISMSEVRRWVRETDNGLEVVFFKWLEWVGRANDVQIEAYFFPLESEEAVIEIDFSLLNDDGYFETRSMDPRKYHLRSILTADGEEYNPEFWRFSVNGRSETYELNLCGDNYNNYNYIQILGVSAVGPPSPPAQMIGEEPRGICG